jgi:hypothetical protein
MSRVVGDAEMLVDGRRRHDGLQNEKAMVSRWFREPGALGCSRDELSAESPDPLV